MQTVHCNNTHVICIYEVTVVLGRTLVILVEVAYGFCHSSQCHNSSLIEAFFAMFPQSLSIVAE
jgi:hypothetical protein